MASNADQLVDEGIKAQRAGDKLRARELLEEAIEIDEMNERAWLWLSGLVDTLDEQRLCLENVLVINPDNDHAKVGLRKLGLEPPAQTVDDPVDTPEEPPARSSSPPPATSSASSVFAGEEPSPEELDSWVDGLGIKDGGNSSPGASPFTMDYDDDVFDDPFDDADFDDVDAPTSAPPASPDPAPAITDQASLRSMMSDDFSDDDFADDVFADDDEDDVFGDDEGVFSSGPFGMDFSDDLPEPESDPRPSSPRRPSPVPEISRERSTSAASSGNFYESDTLSSTDDTDPGEYFRMIPKKVKPTRLPGTKERYPLPAMLSFVLLLVLNAAAVAYLVSALNG